MKKLAAVFLALSLSGCFMLPVNSIYRPDDGIDWNKKPPADYPHLKVIEHLVTHKQIETQCDTKDPFVIGCALANYDWMTCTVYIDKSTDIYRAEIHEIRGHCRGYDHYNSTYFRDKWNKWKKDNGYK